MVALPPTVTNTSIKNETYKQDSLALNFTTDKPTSWMGYSLDGKENVTITGNATLTGLSPGWHNVTVYAIDKSGNTGTSETVSFSIKAEESFPATLIAVAFVASIAAVAFGLLAYSIKKQKNKQSATTNHKPSINR